MKTFSAAELANHSTEDSAYIAINGKIYDVTDFLDAHPGGKRVMLPVLGTDATQVFKLYHSVVTVLNKYKHLAIGVLEGHELESTEPENGDTFGSLVAYAEPGWYQGQYSPYYNDTHKRFRVWIRKIVEEHMMPYVHQWEVDGEVPKSLYKTFGKEGVLSCMTGVAPWPSWAPHKPPCGIKPEEWDSFHELILGDEMARCASVGAGAVLTLGPSIALPCIVHFGTDAMKQKIIGEVLRGEKSIALAITEPFAGSDVANITAEAKLSEDGTHFVLSGEKKWITNGVWADYFIVAARTGGAGMTGISLLLVERGMKGLHTRAIKCQGNTGSGTAFVIMDKIIVPRENVIGKENKGFMCIMKNFNHERFGIIVGAIRSARVCYEDAMHHANRRRTFGKTLFEHGVIRNKLAHMARQIEAAQSWLENLTYQTSKMSQEEAMMKLGGPIALLKAQATQTVEYCAREASQILGGLSYTRGGVGERVERIYRDVRGYAIPGGSEEIMLDLGIRQSVKISQMLGAKM